MERTVASISLLRAGRKIAGRNGFLKYIMLVGLLYLYPAADLKAQIKLSREKPAAPKEVPEQKAPEKDEPDEEDEPEDADMEDEEEDTEEDVAVPAQSPKGRLFPKKSRQQTVLQSRDTASAEDITMIADSLEVVPEMDVRKMAVLQLYDSCMRSRNFPQAYLHIKYLERFNYDNVPEILFYKIKCLIYIADYNLPNSEFVQEIKKSIRTLQEMQEARYQFSKSVDMDWIAKIQMNYFMEGPVYSKWLNDPEYRKAQQLMDKKSFEKAFEYFTLATSHNNALAYYYLGIMYELGMGIPKDAETANTYFEIASESHIGLAHWSLAKNLLSDGTTLWSWSELNSTEQALYLKHMQEAALLNVNAAKYAMGMYYLYDDQTLPKQERNYLAYDWLVNAAKDGNVEAYLKLAEMHCKGIGTLVSQQEASYWIGLAAASQQVSQQKIVELQDCIKDL